MLLRNKSTNEQYHVPSGVGKAMIHAGLAEEAIPATPKLPPRTSWTASQGRYAGIDYQFPPFVYCNCSTCNQRQWVENVTAAFAFRHCGIVEKIPNTVLVEYERLVKAYKFRSRKAPQVVLEQPDKDGLTPTDRRLGAKSKRELIAETQATWELAKKRG